MSGLVSTYQGDVSSCAPCEVFLNAHTFTTPHAFYYITVPSNEAHTREIHETCTFG